VKVGLVCPYPWDVPGGVMAHIRDLAQALRRLGHSVSVLAPVDDEDAPLPPYVVPAGRTVPVRYNGAVARLVFGPLSGRRARRWLRDGDFDVLHLHSPETFSLSLLTLMQASGPIVATFHAANPKSRLLTAMSTALQPQLEKIQGRIAVSPAARKTIVEHLGGDAVIIPNGVDVRAFAAAAPFPGWPGTGGAVGFLGRIDEPRKGLPVLLDAFARLAPVRPGLRLLVAGPGDGAEVRRALPAPLRDRVVLLGLVSEADKPRFFASLDVYCAPHVGGESFGVVLLEAMAAGAPIAASDLDAFRRVLDDGRAGALFPPGNGSALAGLLAELLDDPDRRRALAATGRRVVPGYDWSAVALAVVGVYETVRYAAPEQPLPVAR
jgi:phosphatidylinositol alpha-mannosyltransferase